jgi:hypothetical protein
MLDSMQMNVLFASTCPAFQGCRVGLCGSNCRHDAAASTATNAEQHSSASAQTYNDCRTMACYWRGRLLVSIAFEVQACLRHQPCLSAVSPSTL